MRLIIAHPVMGTFLGGSTSIFFPSKHEGGFRSELTASKYLLQSAEASVARNQGTFPSLGPGEAPSQREWPGCGPGLLSVLAQPWEEPFASSTDAGPALGVPRVGGRAGRRKEGGAPARLTWHYSQEEGTWGSLVLAVECLHLMGKRGVWSSVFPWMLGRAIFQGEQLRQPPTLLRPPPHPCSLGTEASRTGVRPAQCSWWWLRVC